MDEKDYVSFEVAKKLEEKGFKPRGVYLWDRGMLLPTLYEAHKWLRSKGINVCVANVITIEEPVEWFYAIDLIYSGDGVFPMEYYPSYEEALNNGIERALKLI